MKRKKNTYLIIRVFFSTFLLGLLLFMMRDNFNNFWVIIMQAKPGLLFTMLFFIFFLVYVSSLRLQCLLAVQGIFFNTIEIMKILFVSFFFNNFIPANIGAIIIKLFYIKKRSKSYTEPITAIAMDKIISVITKILLGACGLLVFRSYLNNFVLRAIIIFLFFGAGFLWMIFSVNFVKNKLILLLDNMKLVELKKMLKQIYNSFFKFKKSSCIIKVFLLSLMHQAVMILAVYILALSISVRLPLFIFFTLLPAIELISNLPSINGLGVREGAFVYFFKDFIPAEKAFALSILYLGVILFLSFMGGLIYLFHNDFKEKKGGLNEKHTQAGIA
ncbi:MAG: lysylphosphatidylglycerol synthase transmembrane domain-containing protein [Candidatus Omnitrophota bacterium]